MGLPKVDVPTYDLIIPSTQKKIKIRPFTVKEEKILLHAIESEDIKEMEQATRQVIINCLVGKIDVDKLTTYDIEYLFLQLRARSVGETLELKFQKVKDSECKTCSKVRQVQLDLLSVQVIKDPRHETKIAFRPDLGVIMKDPSFGLLRALEEVKQKQSIEDAIKIMAQCVEAVYDAEKIHHTKDVPLEEVVEFLESLSAKEFDKLNLFFESLPKLKHVLAIDCKECGRHQEYHMEGLKDFLA